MKLRKNLFWPGDIATHPNSNTTL